MKARTVHEPVTGHHLARVTEPACNPDDEHQHVRHDQPEGSPGTVVDRGVGAERDQKHQQQRGWAR